MVNGQRLLKLIRQAIVSQPAATDEAAPQSLARVMRAVQSQLRPLESSIPTPAMPLATAETVAAFVDRQATVREEEQVVQACVHDVGILLQVVSAVEAEIAIDSPASPALHARLLAMHRSAETPNAHVATNRVQAELVDAMPAMPIATKVLPGQRPMRGDRIMPWAAAGMLAACLLAACGWLVMHAIVPVVSGGGETNQIAENKVGSVPDPERAVVSIREDDPSGDLNSQTDEELPIIAEAVDPRESKLAQERREEASADDHGDEQGHVPETAIARGYNPDTSAQDPIAMIPSGQENRLNPNPRHAAVIRWTRVAGILAEQKDAGYDHWKVISENREREPLTEDIALKQGSWLTLPTCFAQGELASGGRLVMDQDTHMQLSDDSQDRMKVDVQFGSIALIDMPAGQRLSIETSAASATELTFRSLGSVQIQRIAGGIQFTVAAGDVAQDGTQIPRNKRVIYRQEVRELGPDAGFSSWAVDMPKSSELPRQILANFTDVDDLGEAMDRQLASMARNLNPSNPLSVKNFRQLCQWRSCLSVEEPISATKHAVWLVRNAAFDSILLSNDRLSTLIARKDLLARLQGVSVIRIRAWAEMARGGQKPTRQDVSQWLSLLANEDSVVAAFGDYLLRKHYPTGPMFDPNADVGGRRETQRAWRVQVAGG